MPHAQIDLFVDKGRAAVAEQQINATRVVAPRGKHVIAVAVTRICPIARRLVVIETIIAAQPIRVVGIGRIVVVIQTPFGIVHHTTEIFRRQNDLAGFPYRPVSARG